MSDKLQFVAGPHVEPFRKQRQTEVCWTFSRRETYVKGVEFDREGEYSQADVEAIRQQLAAPGWDRIVGVRSKRDGENVEVFLMINNNAVIEGIGVLISEPKQIMVVNVVGPLDPEKINNLRGQFGIPKDFALDFGGAKRTRRRDN